MFLDVCFSSKASWRILILLASSPGRGISRQEIKKFTKLGTFALDAALRDLISFDIVLENRIGKRLFYKINKNNEFTQEIIKICELERKKLNNLYLSETLCIREFVRKAVDTKIKIHKLIFFGSRVKGSYKEDSDYDICIVFEEEQSMNSQLSFTEIQEKIEERFKVKLQIHFFHKKEFEALRKGQDNLVMEILRDEIEII